MERSFALSLTGKEWWKPFIVYWIVFLLFYVFILTLQYLSPGLLKHPVMYFLLVLVATFVIVADQAVFTIVAYRIALPRLKLAEQSFAFRGAVGRYLGMTLLGMLLSVVTLTIYMPWYIRRITAYLVGEVSYDGASPEFLSRGGKLLVYFLLALWLPVIVISVLIGLVVGFTAKSGQLGNGGGLQLLTTLLTFIIFLLMIPFFYFFYKWYVNLRWKESVIRWVTRFWPSVGFILGQVLLTLITFGIYWPAAALRMFRYFAGKTAVSKGDVEVGRFAFTGSIGKGFGLIWGQTLLSIITIGFYLPWGLARIGCWILEECKYRTGAAQA